MSTDIKELQYPIGECVVPESYTEAELKQWISVIAALPQWLDHCIENLDAAQLDTPYRPGGWTINQVIHHLADSHINAVTRLKFALTEDKPTIKPYNEKAWALLPDVAHTPVNVSITLLHALHRRWVAILENMTPEDFKKEYYHPEDDRHVPLWAMTSTYAWHSRHHMEHVRQLRERMGW
ncbi:MAG: putative metal-dependent hydrolase [Flavipsychrobacter sp.]